jgi:hypothetical protein
MLCFPYYAYVFSSAWKQGERGEKEGEKGIREK